MTEKPDATIHQPVFERSDERGDFAEIVNSQSWVSISHGKMAAGAVMGQHYHKLTELFFYITEGAAQVILEDVNTGARNQATLKARQGLLLKPYVSHRISYLEESRFLILKSRAYLAEDSDSYPHPIEGNE